MTTLAVWRIDESGTSHGGQAPVVGRRSAGPRGRRPTRRPRSRADPPTGVGAGARPRSGRCRRTRCGCPPCRQGDATAAAGGRFAVTVAGRAGSVPLRALQYRECNRHRTFAALALAVVSAVSVNAQELEITLGGGLGLASFYPHVLTYPTADLGFTRWWGSGWGSAVAGRSGLGPCSIPAPAERGPRPDPAARGSSA